MRLLLSGLNGFVVLMDDIAVCIHWRIKAEHVFSFLNMVLQRLMDHNLTLNNNNMCIFVLEEIEFWKTKLHRRVLQPIHCDVN